VPAVDPPVEPLVPLDVDVLPLELLVPDPPTPDAETPAAPELVAAVPSAASPTPEISPSEHPKDACMPKASAIENSTSLSSQRIRYTVA